MPADNFSARWTKPLTVAEAGAYTFTVTTDDGFRLFIDGLTVLDKWVMQGATTYTVDPSAERRARTRSCSSTSRRVATRWPSSRYEPTAEPAPATARRAVRGRVLRQQRPSPGTRPHAVRTTPSTSTGARARPHSGVPADRFSVRWTRTKTYAAGTYRFTVTGDDGIRVLVDGTSVVDGWFYQAPTTYSADVPLTEGEHTVVVEYFEWTGGAVARFSETKLADPGP